MHASNCPSTAFSREPTTAILLYEKTTHKTMKKTSTIASLALIFACLPISGALAQQAEEDPLPPKIPEPSPGPDPISISEPEPIQEPFPEETESEKIQRLIRENRALQEKNSDLQKTITGLKEEIERLDETIMELQKIILEQIKTIMDVVERISMMSGHKN